MERRSSDPTADVARDIYPSQASDSRDEVVRDLARSVWLSAVRLVVVIGVGATATVYLSRSFSPAEWGIWSACWSAATVIVATLVYGPRDRLASDINAGVRTIADARATGLLLSLVAMLISGSALLLINQAEASRSVLLVAAGAAFWTTLFPLRLTALVDALANVHPGRIMIFESFDQVAIQLVAAIAVFVGGGVGSFSLGLASSATAALLLAILVANPFGSGSSSISHAVSVASDARHLMAQTGFFTLREVGTAPLLFVFAGATAAGVMGLAIMLGAFLTLSLAAASQPAYGSLTRLAHDPEQSRMLTMGVGRIVGTAAGSAALVLWVTGGSVIQMVFGSQWNEAVLSICMVVSGAALYASSLPSINVLVSRKQDNAALMQVQGLSFIVVLGGVAAAAIAGQVEAAAGGYLLGQLLLHILAAHLARRAVGASSRETTMPVLSAVIIGATAAVLGGGSLIAGAAAIVVWLAAQPMANRSFYTRIAGDLRHLTGRSTDRSDA